MGARERCAACGTFAELRGSAVVGRATGGSEREMKETIAQQARRAGTAMVRGLARSVGDLLVCAPLWRGWLWGAC